MEIKERFLKYVSINTQADEDSSSVPSSACQLDLARILAQECKEIGFDEDLILTNDIDKLKSFIR